MAYRLSFRLICSELGNWHWSCFLPTQLKKEKDRKDAILNMSRIIRAIQKGRFEIIEHNLKDGNGEVIIPGGIRHLMSYLNREKPKRKRRKVKRANNKTRRIKRSIHQNLRRKGMGKRIRSRK